MLRRSQEGLKHVRLEQLEENWKQGWQRASHHE
jgi:hypothetical protein